MRSYEADNERVRRLGARGMSIGEKASVTCAVCVTWSVVFTWCVCVTWCVVLPGVFVLPGVLC